MKRHLTLGVLVAVSVLLAVDDLVAWARSNTASGALSASELVTCAAVGGQPSDILYYLLPDEPSPVLVREEYIDTGTGPGIIFDDGTGPHRRVVHEFRSPIVRAVCEADRAQFEAQFGIQIGSPIQGELFAVLSSGTGVRVGTVFVDSGTSGRRATGGGLSVQQTYSCVQGGQTELALQNVSLFNSAFDVRAIDGVQPKRLAREYVDVARNLLADRAETHVVAEGCTRLGFDDFAALVASGAPVKVHYDVG